MDDNNLKLSKVENGICKECGTKGYCINFIIDEKSSFTLCEKCAGSELIKMIKN